MYNMLSPGPGLLELHSRSPPPPHSLLIFLHLFTFFDLKPLTDARVRRTTRGAILFMISEILFADRDSNTMGVRFGMIECVSRFMSHRALKF